VGDTPGDLVAPSERIALAQQALLRAARLESGSSAPVSMRRSIPPDKAMVLMNPELAGDWGHRNHPRPGTAIISSVKASTA